MRRVTFLKPLMLATALLASAPVSAEIRIIQSPGGQVGPFLDLFEKVRESGERVVIDGPCLSACTLVLSVVLHSFISGAPFRLRQVAQALEQVTRLPGVWLTTPAEIHAAVLARPALFPQPAIGAAR